MQSVFTDNEDARFNCIRIDYDTEGVDEDALTEVDQGDDTTQLAFVSGEDVAFLPDDFARYHAAALESFNTNVIDKQGI